MQVSKQEPAEMKDNVFNSNYAWPQSYQPWSKVIHSSAHVTSTSQVSQVSKSFLIFPVMASKPVNIHWIRIGFQSYWTFMSSIVLYPVFCEYLNKNHKINTIVVSPGHRPFGSNKTGFNLIIFHSNILDQVGLLFLAEVRYRGNSNPLLIFNVFQN